MKIEVYRTSEGWRWRVVARNGRIMATGHEAYNNMKDARRTARKVTRRFVVTVTYSKDPRG